MNQQIIATTYSGYNFDIEGAISKAIDYMLEAVDKAQLASHERLTERVKREEQNRILAEIAGEN